MKLAAIVEADYVTVPAEDAVIGKITNEDELRQVIAQLEAQMREAAKKFEFERAAGLRDRIRALQQRDLGAIFSATVLNVDPAATQLNVEPAADSSAPPAPSAPNQPAPVSNLSPASNSAIAASRCRRQCRQRANRTKISKPAAKRRAR